MTFFWAAGALTYTPNWRCLYEGATLNGVPFGSSAKSARADLLVFLENLIERPNCFEVVAKLLEVGPCHGSSSAVFIFGQ